MELKLDMPRLTYEARMLINNNIELSLGKLQALLVDKTTIKYSREGIRLFRKKQTEKNNLPKLDKLDTPKKKVRSTPRKQRNGFDFSINSLRKLLDKNPNHYWHDYVEYQIFGKDGKGGRLRSDLQKIFDFTRDVTE